MSGQQPGPVPETTPGGTPAPVATPVNTQHADVSLAPAPFANAQHDAGRPAPAEAPGWGAPPQSAEAPGWGAPTQSAAAPGWGAPGATPAKASTGKPWTLKRGLAVAGAAVVLAAGAGVGVYALSSSSAAADGTTRGAAGGFAGPGGQGSVQGGPGSAQGGFAGGGAQAQGGPGNAAPGGAAGMAGGLSAAVHAEYVVLQGSGYVTKAEQLGIVTDVSTTSVTVKSSDGFTRSYALGGDVVVSNLQQRRQQAGGSTGSQLSVADIVAGGTVRIVAAKDGSDYTAESVLVVAATATGQSN